MDPPMNIATAPASDLHSFGSFVSLPKGLEACCRPQLALARVTKSRASSVGMTSSWEMPEEKSLPVGPAWCQFVIEITPLS